MTNAPPVSGHLKKGVALWLTLFVLLVEAAGIEPASEGIPLELLHAYPVY